jgi:AcrR family transcriptional regulator
MRHPDGVRADARRNRDRILGAARELVAETGVEVTMEDIARRAQVAVGTLYRHFPAKDDLVAAVIEDSVARIADHAERALAAVEAGAAAGPELAMLFRIVAERHATDRAFKAAAGRLDVTAELATAPPGSAAAGAATAVAELLRRAQAGGAVRGDVTAADLAVLLAAVPGQEVPPDIRARFVEIVIAGLAVPPAP